MESSMSDFKNGDLWIVPPNGGLSTTENPKKTQPCNRPRRLDCMDAHNQSQFSVLVVKKKKTKNRGRTRNC